MRSPLFAVALFFVAVVATAETKDLGFGFRRVTIAESNPPNSFESVGYFEYLFYRDRKLARLDECSVSPHGDSVVYQEASSGNIFLFRRAASKTTQLTRKFPGLAYRFAWHEPEGYISIFVVPSSTSKKPGRWITVALKPKT
jgi:hypothetical protein